MYLFKRIMVGMLVSFAVATPSSAATDFAVVFAQPGDTLESLAAHHLGDARKAWLLAEFNHITRLSVGQEVVIPLHHPNPAGISAEGYQVVPVLTYSRLGPQADATTVTPADFERQMTYLQAQGYRMVPLRDVIDFISGAQPLPQRAIALSFDGGDHSQYEFAWPVLKKLGFPATFFITTDAINTPRHLTWAELQALQTSGLISVETQGKTPRHLGLRDSNESTAQYAQRIAAELTASRQQIEQHLHQPVTGFAYPHGDVTPRLLSALTAQGYRYAVTQQPGSNAAFSAPLLVHRTPVRGDADFAAFKRGLTVIQPLPHP